MGERPKLGMPEPQYTSIPQNVQDTFHTHSKIFFVFFWDRKCNQRDHVYLHILARLHTEDSGLSMKGNSNIHNPKYTLGWGYHLGAHRLLENNLPQAQSSDSRRAPRYASKCYISSHNYRSALATRRHPPATTK